MWLETLSKQIIKEKDKRTVHKEHTFIYPYKHGFLLKRERLSNWDTLDQIHPFIMYLYLINAYKTQNPSMYNRVKNFNIYEKLCKGDKETIKEFFKTDDIRNECAFVEYINDTKKTIITHRVFKICEYKIEDHKFIDVFPIFLSWYYKVLNQPYRIKLAENTYFITDKNKKMSQIKDVWVGNLSYFWNIFYGIEEVYIKKIYTYETTNDILVDISMRINPEKLLENESRNLTTIPKIIDFCELNYKQSLYEILCTYSLDKERVNEICNNYYTNNIKHTPQEDRLYEICYFLKNSIYK